MKSGLRVFFLLMLLSALLVACGDDDDGGNDDTNDSQPQTPADIAVTVLTALNERQFDTASQLLCDASASELAENTPSEDAPLYSNIECAEDDSVVICTYSLELDGSTVKRDEELVFDIDGDKLCLQ